MRHLKTYEKILNKNIQIGRFYRINNIYIDNKKVFPIVKLLDKHSNFILVVQGYFEDDSGSINFRTHKTSLTNIASPEEIKKFELYELTQNAKKYNI